VLLMSFGDLPARVVFLLACAGFSLGGELYPTDLTSVLTISEGFPAAFLSTSMLVKLGEPELRLAAILHEEGAVPGQVMKLLNDVYEIRKGVRPFLLSGDPAGPALRPIDWPPGRRKLPLAFRKGLLLVRPPTGSDGQVLAATTAEGRPLEVLRGHEMVAVLRELEVPSKSKEVRIEDRTARLDALATWLQDAMERLEYAATVERAIARSLGPRLSDTAGASALFAELSEIRRQASACVQAALAAVQRSRERRMWSPHLEDLQLSSCQGLMAWDRLAADLFCEALWEEELGALLADGAEMVSRSRLAPPSPCPFAPNRHTVIETMEQPRCFGNHLLNRRVCMLCGVTEVWAEGGPRLRLCTSGEVHPGGTIGIGVEISGASASTSDQGGIIAVVLYEKLTSRLLFRSVAPVPSTSTPLAFEASLPEDLLPETHGVLAVHLDRAHWTLAVLRLPAIWLPAQK
jgi:hypothetical protein